MSEKELKMFDMNAQLNAAFSKEGSSKRKKKRGFTTFSINEVNPLFLSIS